MKHPLLMTVICACTVPFLQEDIVVWMLGVGAGDVCFPELMCGKCDMQRMVRMRLVINVGGQVSCVGSGCVHDR